MSRKQSTGVTSPAVWHSALMADRLERAEHLKLPSGVTILAVKPEPLEWILSGRIPQHLLGAALDDGAPNPGANKVMSREEILDLAIFARRLVLASVVKPPIGDGPGEVALDDIPVNDRAFIFEWACRALKGGPNLESRKSKLEKAQSSIGHRQSAREDLSSDSLERFRKE